MRSISLLGSSLLGLVVLAPGMCAQQVSLEPEPAGTWTVSPFYVRMVEVGRFGDPVVRGSRHLAGVGVQYGLTDRIALELEGAGHVADDGLGFGADLLGVSFVHALRPLQAATGPSWSLGYTLGLQQYDTFEVRRSASAELWSRVRLFGDADRSLALAAQSGGWYVRTDSGRSTDLSGSVGVEATVARVTVGLAWLVESNATFFFDDAVSLGLSFQL